MSKLLFPTFSCKTILANGRDYIWCLLRKKYVRLTPEEWVRQHTINYLVAHLDYPAGRMQAECTISRMAGHWQRADIVLYDKQKKISMIAECKSIREKLCQATVKQMMRYNDDRVPLLIFTNGLQLFCFQRKPSATHYTLCSAIPHAPQMPG